MSEPETPTSTAAAGKLPASAIYFDGATNRKLTVELRFGPKLDIIEDGATIATWGYDDLRMVDGAPGLLNLLCVSAPPLARLEIHDEATRRDIEARSRFLHAARRDGYANTGRILAWSLAAAASIVLVVLYGIPFVAERLTPLIPASFEKRVGDMADNQIRAMFDDKVCTNEVGRAAFAKLVDSIRQAGQLETPLRAEVLGSSEQNAFALPGGKVYLLNGLLQKAENPDELAGVIAHELGHVHHRDHMRMMIETGGTSFLVGLLFGDVTGSGVVIFATRTLVDASHSRAAERHADEYAAHAMHKLGRSPKPMGDFLFRITGTQGNKTIGILASHPLTEDRRETMRREDRPNTGPELLSASEWQALKAICR